MSIVVEIPLKHALKQARDAAERGDRSALAEIGLSTYRELEGVAWPPNSWFPSTRDGVWAELDAFYDEAFPPPADTADLTDLLDAPWPTGRRLAILAALTGGVHRRHERDPLAAEVLAAPPSTRRTRLLRLMICSPVGVLGRNTAAKVIEALFQADALDAELVEVAFSVERYLGNAVFGWTSGLDGWQPPVVGADCAAAVRDHLDPIVWRLTAAPNETDWERIAPLKVPPRGLRFVLRGLDIWAGRLPVAPDTDGNVGYKDALVRRLSRAELTAAESERLVMTLRERSEAERLEALGHRHAAGDSMPLLALFGLERAAPLLRLLFDLTAQGIGESVQPVRCDLAELRGAVAAAGEGPARRLIELLKGRADGLEPVLAAMGWNRAAVLKRFRNKALQGIAAYGLLPIDDGESVLDRYLALRESAKNGAKLGPNRRHSHAAAVEIALDHLAQVAGYPAAARLEWDMESRIATEVPDGWRAGDYEIAVRIEGADAVIVVERGGRALKTVPSAVRKEPAYAEARAHQERLRDQARRMRTGLLERLVATADRLGQDELAALLALPAGAVLLPGLIWSDGFGVVGLLDPVGGPALVGLDGVRVPVTGPLSAAHPLQLDADGTLSGWQAELVRRGISQPVKQAFREIYRLTPAERHTRSRSLRFADTEVDGPVAVQLLSARGWSTYHEYADWQATRRAGDLTAAVAAELSGGHFSGGPVRLGAAVFLRDGVPVDLTEVPATVFSEAMRDLDLVVSAAPTVTSA
ncbi:DUF4132 domain-containing protein [Actinoplanes solisilvae]|uniref:DUF4132 domain-containing protein n=1 Tax=Actinoplanes solisilvae TaxID=2486853 RepID=UPI000FDA61A4|nr:DUF4132 domain-containing protein [Actinoplanes solisilvae]